LLGSRLEKAVDRSLGDKFAGAGADLWNNFEALFTPAHADWHKLGLFYDDVFFPYLVGGLIPGVVAATVSYYLCLPLISVYQKRRRKRLQAKLDQLRKKSEPTDDLGHT